MNQPDHGTKFLLKVNVRQLFYFTKYLPEYLINTMENDNDRLSTSLE